MHYFNALASLLARLPFLSGKGTRGQQAVGLLVHHLNQAPEPHFSKGSNSHSGQICPSVDNFLPHARGNKDNHAIVINTKVQKILRPLWFISQAMLTEPENASPEGNSYVSLKTASSERRLTTLSSKFLSGKYSFWYVYTSYNTSLNNIVSLTYLCIDLIVYHLV